MLERINLLHSLIPAYFWVNFGALFYYEEGKIFSDRSNINFFCSLDFNLKSVDLFNRTHLFRIRNDCNNFSKLLLLSDCIGTNTF